MTVSIVLGGLVYYIKLREVTFSPEYGVIGELYRRGDPELIYTKLFKTVSDAIDYYKKFEVQ